MEIITVLLLTLAAFLLGSVPFSVIVGHRLLGKNIRDYGDGNPGSANVFRAGGGKYGYLAVFLDVAKGFPVVFLAHASLDVSNAGLVIIGLGAMGGHAFSPFLKWRGGKAIAITFGVLLALPDLGLLFTFIPFVIIGILVLDVDGWGMTFGAAGTLVFRFISYGATWELALMLGITAVYIIKHFEDLRRLPGFRGRLYRWVQALGRDTTAPR